MWLVEFGQSHESFGEVFIDEWEAAYDVWLDASARAFLIGGTVVAAILNTNRKKGGKTVGPSDVFPHLRRNRRRPKERTPEQLTAILRAVWAPSKTKRPRTG